MLVYQQVFSHQIYYYLYHYTYHSKYIELMLYFKFIKFQVFEIYHDSHYYCNIFVSYQDIIRYIFNKFKTPFLELYLIKLSFSSDTVNQFLIFFLIPCFTKKIIFFKSFESFIAFKLVGSIICNLLPADISVFHVWLLNLSSQLSFNYLTNCNRFVK